MKKWRAKNPLLEKESRQRWRKKNPLRAKEFWKKQRDNKRFGGNRLKVLERDNYTCQMCGKTHHEIILNVHHTDGTGRGKKVHNNNISNLVTLCCGCHASLHQKGKHLSGEHKRKISEAMKGKGLGIPLPEETRRHMSEARKRYWEAKKMVEI